jgi:hypothetical protein
MWTFIGFVGGAVLGGIVVYVASILFFAGAFRR